MTPFLSASRRAILGLAAGGLVLQSVSGVTAAVRRTMEVWKAPTCGCCADWVALIEKAGFVVKVHDLGNSAKRAALGMPQKFGSCHTAVSEGYVFEGHVPVTDILRLLEMKPKALGLAVPGMPIGSPGMDGAVYEGRRDPYNVLLIDLAGTSSVFRSVR